VACPPLALNSNHHLAQSSNLKASGLPRGKEVACGDGATDALFGADGPVLREEHLALGVGLELAPHLVGAAIAVKVAKARRVDVIGRVVHTKVLNHIEFGRGVVGPAVQRKICVAEALGDEGSRVIKLPVVEDFRISTRCSS
jgi:hypothetical protein